jgi:hypothetical protein
MADKYALKLAALLGKSPKQGGLMYGDYPHPFRNPNVEGGGLRAYINKDGSYGGEMMPKGQGWLNEQMTPQGQTMTELSVGNGQMDFPSLTPNQPPELVRQIVNTGEVSPQAYRNALDWAMSRKAKGLSPFRDAEDK